MVCKIVEFVWTYNNVKLDIKRRILQFIAYQKQIEFLIYF